MQALQIANLCTELKTYLENGIKFLYQMAKHKPNKIVYLTEQIETQGGRGYYITGITINRDDELLFTQVDDNYRKEDPQFLRHLDISILVEVYIEMQKVSQTLYTKPFTWANTGIDTPCIAIEVEGGNVQYAYSNCRGVAVSVIDIDHKKRANPGEEYHPGIYLVERLSNPLFNKYLNDAGKVDLH